MRRLAYLAALVCTTALAGCGGQQVTTSFNENADPRYTEQQVADLAGFQTDESGLSWTWSGCSIGVIMTTRAAVEMYAGAGDAVVTNPRGDVGVKFAADPGCREALQQALRRIK